VKATYPHLNIHFKGFDNGKDKVEYIIKLIEAAIPCVLSIAKTSTGGFWHIVPVVSIDNKKIKVIWTDKTATPKPREFTINEIIYRHDNWPGGNDIAWIEK